MRLQSLYEASQETEVPVYKVKCQKPIKIEELRTMKDIVCAYNERRLLLSTVIVDGQSLHAEFEQYATVDENLDVYNIGTSGGSNIRINHAAQIASNGRIHGQHNTHFVTLYDEVGVQVQLHLIPNPAISLLRLFGRTNYLAMLTNYNELAIFHADIENNRVDVVITKLSKSAVTCEPDEISTRRTYALDSTAVIPYDYFYRNWFEIVDNSSLEKGVLLNVTKATLERKK